MSQAPVHSSAFRRRRFFNWAPLGLTYAFLYMGRYNLTVAKAALGDLMSLEQFGAIFGIGAVTYGFSFLINGPMTDKMGGRRAILIAAMGSGIMNALMGVYTRDYILSGSDESPVAMLSLLYAINMYFQSFGAVAIVKVNSNWFHVGERGTFSAIFGAIISFGILLAFDVGYRIVGASLGQGPGGVDATWWVFFSPAVMLGLFFMVDFFLVKNEPSDAGQKNFDTGAAKMGSGDDEEDMPVKEVLRRILTNPIILTVAAIEFCTGILRNGIMHWYPLYAKTELVLQGGHFMRANWGLVLFAAGVMGGTFAGLVSDKLFQSRRAPAAGGLYGGMAVAILIMIFSLGGTEPKVGWITEPSEAAVSAGLQTGDRVTSYDDTDLKDRSRFLAAMDKDGPHTLGVLRDGKTVTIKLDMNKETRKNLKLRKGMVTLKGQEIDGKKRTVLHWKGAWAYETGLRKGDKVLEINGEAPEDWGQVQKLIKRDGTDNLVKLDRDGKELALTMVYPKYAPQTPEYRANYVAAGPVQTLNPMVLGFLAFFISLCVIGSHGLLSGTATMDFGGKKGTATAVGVIDGAVYLGTGLQSFALGYITSKDWSMWPVFLLPFAVIGFYFCTKIWHAKPRSNAGGH